MDNGHQALYSFVANNYVGINSKIRSFTLSKLISYLKRNLFYSAPKPSPFGVCDFEEFCVIDVHSSDFGVILPGKHFKD